MLSVCLLPCTYSNYTLRVMPLPLADIGRAGKDSEGIVQEIQLLLCRNHSDERLKVELAARHRGRLLTATQQSVSGLCTCMYSPHNKYVRYILHQIRSSN